MRKKPALTVEERRIGYSKYYDMEMVAPDPEAIAFLNRGPIDPSTALAYENVDDLLKPGYLESEMGYCILPDGGGYVSNLTRMPGVTPEMFSWWFVWHGLHPLRYKIWDPYEHFGLEINEKDRKRLLDPSIPLHERIWGVRHTVREDIGWPGPLALLSRITGKDIYKIDIDFQSPKDFGFREDPFASPNCGTAVCGDNKMCHFVRETEGGVELRTRFWFGYDLIDGKPVRNKEKFPLFIVKALNMHNVIEFTNLAFILPKVYAEEKDNWI